MELYICSYCRKVIKTVSHPDPLWVPCPVGCPAALYHDWVSHGPADPAVLRYLSRLPVPSARVAVHSAQLARRLKPAAQQIAMFKARKDRQMNNCKHFHNEWKKEQLSWEVSYMQSVQKLLMENPGIMEHLSDLQRAAEAIRQKYLKRYWAALRGNLASSGLILGAIDFNGWIVFFPITIKVKTTAKRQSKVVATIWCNQLGDEICISQTLPRDMGDAVRKILDIQMNRDESWRAATLLPSPHANNTLIRLVQQPGKLKRMAGEASSIIRQYLQRATTLPGKGRD